MDQVLEGCCAVIECRVRGGKPATEPFFFEDQNGEEVQVSRDAAEGDDTLGNVRVAKIEADGFFQMCKPACGNGADGSVIIATTPTPTPGDSSSTTHAVTSNPKQAQESNRRIVSSVWGWVHVSDPWSTCRISAAPGSGVLRKL